MKLESQVCSLDLAKRLKGLGMKQESYCYWFDHKWRGKYPEHENDFVLLTEENEGLYPSEYWDKFAAFTVAELGEMLPLYTLSIQAPSFYPNAPKHLTGRWVCDEKDGFQQTTADTEADARAKMLIHLIEQGIINPKDTE